MATVLFINRTDLVRNSIIDGNVDTDKFIQFIKIAQQIDIQQIIGTKMYDGLTDAIVAGINEPANARWKTILDEYIVNMLIWYAQSNYIPSAPQPGLTALVPINSISSFLYIFFAAIIFSQNPLVTFSPSLFKVSFKGAY